jgi:hypothetical protein
MAFEEDAEVVQPGVGDDVDDHAAAGEVDGCSSAAASTAATTRREV